MITFQLNSKEERGDEGWSGGARERGTEREVGREGGDRPQAERMHNEVARVANSSP